MLPLLHRRIELSFVHWKMENHQGFFLMETKRDSERFDGLLFSVRRVWA
jgi:hypothetical protein